MVRKYMKTIIVGIVAIIAMVVGLLIATVVAQDEISTTMVGVITALVAPTVAALVQLLNSQQQKEQLDRVENRTKRIDRVVNHETEIPHDSTVDKYRK